MNEEDENMMNIIQNDKQKKQLQIFSQKVEEIINEYKNRKKFGLGKLKEDNLQKVDLKQYNDFFDKVEEQKNKVNTYKMKLNNDFKFSEITQKEDELNFLKNEYKLKEKEYQYLMETNKRLDGFHNNLLNEEINYYENELKKLKDEMLEKNKEHINYNEQAKKIRIEINQLEKEYDLIQKNIELKIDINKNEKLYKEEITDEILKKEKEAFFNTIESVEKEFNRQCRERDILEKEVNTLKDVLSKYRYNAHINELKIKEVLKIENEKKLNNINEQKKILNLKKNKEKEKKLNAKKIKNLMAESFKNNFPFKNNYKIFLEEEKKQKIILNKKLKLDIPKYKMNVSRSSADIFKTKREQLKSLREKEKDEFMNNLDKELKEHEEKKEIVIQEIKLLKDDIEKSLGMDKLNDIYLDNIQNEKNENK
jgi:hypothetical protein